ncbi:MAG: hypothetical protein ABI592_16650 [Acidobacteriota bacterium]
MRRTAVSLVVLLLAAAAAAPAPAPERTRAPRKTPRLGLDAELPASATDEERDRAARQVRESGVSLYALSVFWPDAEPSPGQYRLDPVLRAARVLRQSGATIHLDLPLVSPGRRGVASDLAATAFDDPKLSLRLGRLLDALEPALLDASTLSLGEAADAYFAGRPDELKAFRRLYSGAVEFLAKKAPHLKVGVTTASPGESPAPEIASLLQVGGGVVLYAYAPFDRAQPYVHRPPDAIARDWKNLVAGAGGRPIAFPEVSYSSAPENGSSPQRQAEFVRRFRQTLAAADGDAILFARWVSWRDGPPPAAPAGTGPAAAIAARRAAFLARRGLQTARGEPKPAWKEWLRP